MQALLEIIAALVLWGASVVLAQFGVEADFARPVAPVSALARPDRHAAPGPRETPAACPGQRGETDPDPSLEPARPSVTGRTLTKPFQALFPGEFHR